MINIITQYIRQRLNDRLISVVNMGYNASIPDTIESIFRNTILTDLNLLSGKELVVRTSDCRIMASDSKQVILEVPEDLLSGAKINDCTMLFTIANKSVTRNNSNITDGTSYIPDGRKDGYVNAKTHVVAYNTIQVDKYDGSYIDFFNTEMHLQVSYGPGLDGINRKYGPLLSEYALTAVKMAIYKARLDLDYVSNGAMPISDMLLSAINEFSDAEEEYRTNLDNLAKIGDLNNGVSQMMQIRYET